MMTRRQFVGTLGGLAAATGLGFGLAGPVRRRLDVAAIDAAVLAPLAGRRITLVAPDGTRHGALVTAVNSRRRPGRRGAPTTEQMSLLVRPDDPATPGGDYRLHADELDCEAIGFSAVGPDGRCRELEAVFTRIV
ncbi:hypothetical protein KDM41_07360 [bacterium]|nr:hypothetical protein [bacterium]